LFMLLNINPMYCNICKETLTKIDNLSQDPTTEKIIAKVIGELCYLLPITERIECENFTSNYNQIISLI